jgi:hypothetical protein
MGRAKGVDVDLGSLLRPPASGSGMVEVDVRDEQVADVLGLAAMLGQSGNEGWQG